MKPQGIEVAIVGGGLAGLTAACYLAKAGVDVTLFEKASHLGGRASTQYFDGYSFNRGIHALYTGGAASQVLEDLGIPYSGHSPADVSILYQGEFHTAPYTMLTLMRSSLFGIMDKLELMRIFAKLPRVNAQELANVSTHDWLEHNVRHPQVRQLMASLARTFVYSSALDLVSAEVFITKMQLSLKNPVIYIDRGWQTLVQGLRRVAEEAGTNIITGTRVESLMVQNGHIQGIRTNDGDDIQTQAVILAITPKDVLKLLDTGDGTAIRQIINSLIPAQVACLDVALRSLPNSHHAVVQDMERPRFMSTQSLYSRVAPEVGALIYTFKQLDPREKSDPREDERDLEDLLDTAQPAWRDVLVKRQYLPCIDAVGMLPTAEGGGYAGRPGTQVPGIDNLYLAGDWIGDGFLSDASFNSARLASQQIIEHELSAELHV
jgi:phytoene dehydrogenase-like protein